MFPNQLTMQKNFCIPQYILSFVEFLVHWLIRLCQNTLQLAAGMNGGPNRVEARQGEDGLASAQFRFDTPQLAAGSFIRISFQGDCQ